MASQKLLTSHTSTTFNPQVNCVPKFNGEKYDQWSIKMKSILISQGVWDIIQHGYEIPNVADEEASRDETKKESYRQSMRRDHYALSIIHCGVDDTIFPKIMAATTAKEAWSILEKNYQKLEKMENNPQQDEIKVAIDEVLEDDVPSSFFPGKDKCCIYTVPEILKKGKEECYRPLYTSIGPVFYKDPKLQPMQEVKWKLWEYFSKLPDNGCPDLKPYIVYVRKHEREIRECYQEQVNLPSADFIQMIVLDAASIISYFLMMSKRNEAPSGTAKKYFYKERKFRVGFLEFGLDILREENQIPFFVLEGMYDIAFAHINPRVPFIHLALENIGDGIDGFPGKQVIKSIINDPGKTDDVSSGLKHLVHLQRECCCLPYFKGRGRMVTRRGDIHEIPNAKQLSARGVKFKLNISDDRFDITFEKSTGVFRIPKITLDDDTEATLRNIIFFEQSHYQLPNFCFIHCILILDKLIDTVEDIQILQHKGILINHLGSDEDPVNLFNNITRNVHLNLSNFAFSDVSRDVKEYASKRWNSWKALLWSKYFNHPWAIISVIAAGIIIILTILQTIAGFLQLSS